MTSQQPQNSWRYLLRKQSIANVKYWLAQIDTDPQPAILIAKEYENLLRALESVSKNVDDLPLAYALIQTLHATVVDFADWDRWLVYLQNVQKLSKEAGDLSKIANLSVQIGEVAFRMGLGDEAEASFQFGADTYQELDQQANYARTLSKLGILYDLQGNISNGILLCQKALTIAEEIGDDWVIAEAYWNLSRIYYRARDWQASLTAVQTARDYFLKLQRTKEATKTLLTIIAISSEMGDWKQVEALSKSLMEDLIISEDIRTISQLKNNLGVAAFGQENFSRAEAFWQEALTLHSQIQEPLELASLYNNLGMVYTKLNEWDTAEEMLQQAIAAYKSIGDIYHWANALDNLADLYESQEKSADYLKTIRNAINGLQFIKDTPHAHELLNKMQNRILNSPFSPKQIP